MSLTPAETRPLYQQALVNEVDQREQHAAFDPERPDRLDSDPGLGGDVVDPVGRVAAFGKQAPGGGQDVAAGLVGHLLAAVNPRSSRCST